MNLQTLLNKYFIKADINMLLAIWNEPNRHYHNLKHLTDLIDQINKSYSENQISENEKELLYLIAIFHDIVYDAGKQDNEEKSADFFMSVCLRPELHDILLVRNAILATKTHHPTNNISKLFNRFDMNIVERDYDSLLEWEKGIYGEYSSVYDNDDYKQGRIGFLNHVKKTYSNNSENLSRLIEFVETSY